MLYYNAVIMVLGLESVTLLIVDASSCSKCIGGFSEAEIYTSIIS